MHDEASQLGGKNKQSVGGAGQWVQTATADTRERDDAVIRRCGQPRSRCVDRVTTGNDR